MAFWACKIIGRKKYIAYMNGERNVKKWVYGSISLARRSPRKEQHSRSGFLPLHTKRESIFENHSPAYAYHHRQKIAHLSIEASPRSVSTTFTFLPPFPVPSSSSTSFHEGLGVYAKPLLTLLRTDWYSMSSSSLA